MRKQHHCPEEIIAKLEGADVCLGYGKKTAEVIKALGVTEATDSCWWQEYGRMTVSPTRQLKELALKPALQ